MVCVKMNILRRKKTEEKLSDVKILPRLLEALSEIFFDLVIGNKDLTQKLLDTTTQGDYSELSDTEKEKFREAARAVFVFMGFISAFADNPDIEKLKDVK